MVRCRAFCGRLASQTTRFAMVQLYPFTNPDDAVRSPPVRMVSAHGCSVVDSKGNTYLDAVAGLWCASLGFSDARLVAAATKQMEQLAYYHGFMGRTCEVTEQLAEQLVARLPGLLSHVFFGCTGSDAVESAIKLARFYQNARGKPEKKRIIARESAYHGSGIMSASLTAMAYCHEGFDLPDPSVLRTGRPHFLRDAHEGESEQAFAERRARELEDLILAAGSETIAAFIGEPVIGSGGVVLPPDGYWEAIAAVLRRHDILLIADEIITGFGRTGEWFGVETYGIEPDMMTLAKQLSAAHFPISAMAISSHVHEIVAEYAHELGTFGHGFTYGGHPVGAAVALEALRVYEAMDLPQHVKSLGERLAAELSPIRTIDGVDDVRQIGLIAGVELDDRFDKEGDFGRAVGDEARRRGVLFRVIGNTLAISPPLTVSPAEIEHLGHVLYASIESVSSRTALPEHAIVTTGAPRA